MAKMSKVVKRYWLNNFKTFYPEILKTLHNINNISTTNLTIKNPLTVLFYATRQDPLHITWDYVLAKSIELRGHKVKYIACDGLIRNSCNESWYPDIPIVMCKQCHLFAQRFYKEAKLEVSWLGEFLQDYKTKCFKGNENIIEKEDYNKFVDGVDFYKYKDFVYKSVPLGKLVRPSVCHFTRREDIELAGNNDPQVRKIYRHFLVNGVFLVDYLDKIINDINPDVTVLLNGKFASEAIMLHMLQKKGKKSVVFESGIMPDTMSFLHNMRIDYMKVSQWEKRKDVVLTNLEREKLNSYLASRKAGKGQTADYWKSVRDDISQIKSKLNIESFDSVTSLFPNLLFDSANHGKHVQYKTLKEWIASTIRFFHSNQSHALIIRIHPAELKWPQVYRDSVYTWLKNEYGRDIGENIKIIKASSTISSYALMELSDLGLVSTSTTGLEMALMGKPVIVTGKVHYWNRGFTLDPSTDEEFHAMLEQILIRRNIPKLNYELAKIYAYHIFFECSLGLNSINSENYRIIPPKLELSNYNELLPGFDSNLDKICDGIIYDTPFV